MKKLFIICALLTGVVTFSFAQDQGFGGGAGGFGGGFPGGQGGQGGRGQGQGQGATARTPEARAQTYLETLMESFVLNKDQRVQTLAILIAENKSLDSLMATVVPQGGQGQPQGGQTQGAGGFDPAAMQARQAAMQALQPKRKAIMEASEAQFIAVLSDKQKKLYLSSIKDRPEGQGFGVAGRGGQQGQGQGRGGQGREGGFGGGGGNFGGGGGNFGGGGGF